MNTLSYNIGGTTTYDSNPSGSYASSSMTATNAPIPVTVDPNYAANPIPVSSAAAGVYDMSSCILPRNLWPLLYTSRPSPRILQTLRWRISPTLLQSQQVRSRLLPQYNRLPTNPCLSLWIHRLLFLLRLLSLGRWHRTQCPRKESI